MKVLARLVLALLGLGLAWAVLPARALADGPAATSMEILFPPEPAVGQEMALAARVTDPARVGVAGVPVVFTARVSFLNTDDEIELGQATTNQQGIAIVSYIPRTDGNVSISAKFAGDTKYKKSSATGKAAIKPGPPQYAEHVGLKVPGVGVWMLVAVMAGVWGTFLWALRQVRGIFQEGQKVASSEWGRHHV